MADVLVYDKDYRISSTRNGRLHWHSNHRVFADLLPGDRLWVVTSGKALEREDESAGYLVAMWPVAQVVRNPGDDPEYPARKYKHRILINETEAIQLDQPVCVDHIIRREGYSKDVSVGRFLRGPRRLTDEKVRQLRSAAGADLAQKWLTGNRTPPTPVGGSSPTAILTETSQTASPAETPDASRREQSFSQPNAPDTVPIVPAVGGPDTQRPPFHSANMHFAYQLHYHIGFRTRRRVPVFKVASRADVLRDILPAVCQRSDYHVLEFEVEDCWARLLVSLKPSESPAKTVQTVKANSSRLMFKAFPEIEGEIGRRSLWSRGYYARGVGDVPNRVVLAYIARQKEHHEAELGDSIHLADYAHPKPEQFLDLRPFSHCVAEYNCHFVLCPVGHVGAIDPVFARPLIEYLLHVSRARKFDVIRLSVLSDHVHLFAALQPNQSPEFLALTVMNNTSHWFRKHNPGAFKVWDIPGFWAPSAFLRTAGAATTNQVRNHLRRKGGWS